MAGEVVRTGEVFFKVQKRTGWNFGFWDSPPSWHKIPANGMTCVLGQSQQGKKIKSGSGFLLNISGHILIITFQMAQLAPSKSHFQSKKGVLVKTPTKIVLSHLFPTIPVFLCVKCSESLDRITCKCAARMPRSVPSLTNSGMREAPKNRGDLRLWHYNSLE